MVLLYSKPNCIQCDATKMYLSAHGKSYIEVDIMEPENLARVKSWGFMQAPVVDAGNGNKWSGFRPEKIDEL